jgi:ribulose-5-phosphate 4-epimerase/fuculose-1-phosphate aldolase
MNDNDTLIDEVVTANHILAHYDVVDAYGHVSVRATDGGHFYMSRHLAPALVTRADILTFDLDCNVLAGAASKLYSERWIHSAIYAARPDVAGIVHSHSHAVIPFSVTRKTLRPLFHVSSFLGQGGGVARFDTRPVVGDSDLLIRTPELGAALAAVLGDASVVLMRGHGSVAVGSSLREAVYRAIYTEVNAKLQLEALLLDDEITYLSDGEVAKMAANQRDNDPTFRKAWEIWVDKTARARG